MTTILLTPYDQIVAGLQYLSGLDQDHASELNDRGFNGRDTQFGNSLAKQSLSRELSERQIVAALRMLRTYASTQLTPVGLTLPSEVDLQAWLAVRRDTFVRAERQQAQQATPSTQATSDGLIDVVFHAGHQQVTVKIYGGYNETLVTKARNLPGRRYSGAPDYLNSWPGDMFDHVVATFPTMDLTPAATQYRASQEERRQAEHAAHEAEQQRKTKRLAALTAAIGDLGKPLPDGRTAMGHQRDGVMWALRNERGIIADVMGLGKTLAALLTAKAFVRLDGAAVIVLAPKSLMNNWLREAAGVGVPISVHSHAKIPEPLTNRPYVLIADEAHNFQTMTAQRTQKFLALAQADNCVACFPLTGTPIKNGRPANLFPLLKAIRHPLSANQRAYERRYCAAQATRFNPWDTNGAAYLQELHEQLQPMVLRRTKDQCLDLPAKTRILRAAEIGSSDMSAYATLIDTKRTEWERKLRENEEKAQKLNHHIATLIQQIHASQNNDEQYTLSEQLAGLQAEQRKLLNAKNAEAVVMLTALRLTGAIAKSGNAIELAEEIMEEGQQVVLFTNFTDVAKKLGTALGCEVLDGQSQDRQGMVDRFQSGTNKAIVLTMAGGVGITLTKAAYVILVDRPWTPGDAEQIEDRIHRIGQRSACMAIWLQAGKVDVKVDQVLAGKQGRINMVLTGKADSQGTDGTIANVSIHAMAADLLQDIFYGKDEE